MWKGLPEPEKKQSERDQSSEFTEKDRGELKELRKKSSDLMGLVDKLVREVTCQFIGFHVLLVCH